MWVSPIFGDAGGKKAHRGNGEDGGYFKSPAYVREVERGTDESPPGSVRAVGRFERGIGVYYTDLNVGGISFAILEDRKFKSSPLGLVPDRGGRIDHVLGDFDPAAYDHPEAVAARRAATRLFATLGSGLERGPNEGGSFADHLLWRGRTSTVGWDGWLPISIATAGRSQAEEIAR